MNRGLKKIILITLGIIILMIIIETSLIVYKLFPDIQNYFVRQKIEKQNTETMQEILPENVIQTTKPITTTQKLPPKAYLNVPFICQAPLQTEANWKLHEESCEEAAVLQAYLYESGQNMTKPEANTEILKMKNWQKENFGNEHDLYADELKKFITQYYNLKDSEIKIILNSSIDDIKKQIKEGHPVIVPITGHILKNPYYPYPGYHMLTVIGYTESRIITNDNGTRRGKDFSYNYGTFKAAMDDAGGDIVILELDKS